MNGEAAEKDGDSGDGTKRSRPNAPYPAVAVKRVDAKRASGNLARGDAQATSRALQGLNLPNMSGHATASRFLIITKEGPSILLFILVKKLKKITTF